MRKLFLIVPVFFLVLVCPGLSFAQSNAEDGFTTAVEAFGKLSGGQKDTVLSAAGMPMPKASDFSLAKIAASLIFGSIGFIAFFYGKKNSSWIPLSIGIVLMAYPYFVSNTFWLYTIGIGLTASLYFFRE